ncbi:carbamoyl-phosphate synthase L subunit-like protein, partial [Fibrobacter sp. UWR4]
MGNAQKKCQDFNKKTKEELLDMMKTASSERHFQMYEAIRKGATDEEVFAATYEKAYFVQQMRELVELEEKMLKTPGRMPSDELLIQAKKDGFGDKYIAKILGIREKDVRAKRIEL